jgi:hypothetical protein
VAILSVDLAYRRWSDLGIVVLDRPSGLASLDAADRLAESETSAPGLNLHIPAVNIDPRTPAPRTKPDRTICCEILTSLHPGDPRQMVEPDNLAGLLNHLCTIRNIRVILLDGPQAWKSRSNGLMHSRVSERQLNTSAKTGLPGMVKPVTYRAFAEFCLDVYDALCRRGWRRMATQDQPHNPPERILVESYPHAAWKSLGIKPLPSKRRAKVSDLAEAYGALRSIIPFTTNRPPNHDQLQAIVGGLPGLALEERNAAGSMIFGDPPRREEGHWREGFIVLPVAPKPQPEAASWLNGMRWLDYPLSMNSKILCRPSKPCQGSDEGRPKIPPANGPWFSRG